MMPLPLEYQKTTLYAGIIAGAFLLAFALQALVPSTFAAASAALRGSTVAQASDNTVYLQPSAVPQTSAQVIPAELTIAENGFVHVGGATITALGNGTITADLSWGGANLTWAIQPGYAKYFGINGETIDAHALKVGEKIAITGTLSGNSPTPTIDAQYIRVQ